MADKPTQADVKVAGALEKVVSKLTKAVDGLTKSTKDYGKTEKKIFKENLKDLDDVNDDLEDMSRGISGLQGSLKKIKTKGVLDATEVVKYNEELKKINGEILRLHKMKPLSGAALVNQRKSLVKLQGEYDEVSKKIKGTAKDTEDWTASVGRSGPAFLKKWVSFHKAAEKGTTPVDDYGKMLGNAGTKLGKMPGLFKSAGAAAKGMGKILGGVSKAIAGWPLLIAGAIKAVVDITRAADQFQKDANKAFATLRGPDIMGGGEVEKQFRDFNNMIYRAGENIRVGLDVTQIRELLLAARDAGANITNLNKGLMTYRDAIYVASKASKTLGLELPMVGSMMGKMIVDMRMDLDKMDDAFVQIAFDAKKSGLSTDRFWSTVQNASASLALYGVVVKSASSTMKAFTENMVGGADDAASATENMYDTFKTGSFKSHLAIIQFAEKTGKDVPAIFEKMAQEAAEKVKVVEGNIKLIEDKKGPKTKEDVEQLKKLRTQLYAAQSKQNRFEKAAKGGSVAMAAEAGALAKEAPQMIIAAIKGMAGPLHKLEGNMLEVAIQSAGKIGQSEKTVRMLVEISKITEKRMTDLANRSAAYFDLSSDADRTTRERIASVITDVASKTGADQIDAQIMAGEELKSLLEDKLGLMPGMAGDVVKLVKNDKDSAKEIAKILNSGNANMAEEIGKVFTATNAIENMASAAFKDQEKTEGDMADAADDTFKGIVKQTLSYNEMLKIAKNEIQWRLSSLKMFAKVNSGVWNILRFIVGNKPYLTEEQKANIEILKSRDIEVKTGYDGNLLLSDLGEKIREGVRVAEETKTKIKEQNSLIGAMERGGPTLTKEFKRVSDRIADLKKEEKVGTITGAQKQELDALENTKKELDKLNVGEIARNQKLIAALEHKGGSKGAATELTEDIEGLKNKIFKLKMAGAPAEEIESLKKKKTEMVQFRGDLQKIPKDEKKFYTDLKNAQKLLLKTSKAALPGLLKKAKETLKVDQDTLTIMDDNNSKLESLNNEASKTAELQKLMLLSTEGGQKKVASVLKGKKNDEDIFKAISAMGITKDEIPEIYVALQEKALTAGDNKEFERLEAEKERTLKAFEKFAPLSTENAITKPVPTTAGKQDFWDIVKGGFVNVQSGDILVDKNSLAQGMSGPPGAAIPALAGAGGPGKGGAGGAGTTISINVVATEKDLAQKIANQVKKELYNRQISTSSYSLA